ncbi:hypothetical protein KMZ32_06290 [Phycicoccus sp. MAQZ13P-2]|uniref:DUF6286 domain-containing protein n=1 Tax=Phycicoccus mangrovi TaxID=2840470 RepID=UPI001C0082AD|nr:DUF6286 domain-containing protein [Phycicoccus mangrovi]MBT9273680.1 hypothetical protein [Phycicoccus mangrovi]
MSTDTVTTNRTVPSDKSTTPPKAAKNPVGPGAITFIGGLLAIGVIVVGALGLQVAASAVGSTTSTPWLNQLITGGDGLRPLGWMLPVGLLLVLVGLWLLLTALRPRPKTAVSLDARTGVFIRPRDVARLAEHAADDVDGVASVRARATRTKVTLSVDSTGGDEVADAVKSAVTEQLSTLKKAPRVSVRTKAIAP